MSFSRKPLGKIAHYEAKIDEIDYDMAGISVEFIYEHKKGTTFHGNLLIDGLPLS
jgi:hypothetical protein